jgi:Tol biopolymer transport system component/tRNA A-37 threonylcarbamoyl transferase component Bud32
MPLSPGSQLGPYEVLALLGAGGMGEVYRARDPRLGREVAIKVLPHDRVADESRRQRFVQEAKAASALNHPHIITIYEIESANGIDFLVMEYVRGKSLDALIPRQGIRLGEALRIAIAVADAVACAHKSNIVHRDLKPANVMVGTDGAVKVLDFGLAKLLTDDGDSDPHGLTRTADEAITKRGAVMGTLAYMSPEQASGEPVDARSDVFSFGAMLYEMVTGVGPFADKTPTDTLANVLRAQPKPPTDIVPTLPRELERLILRCLRREPGRRFQHMVDVRVDLQEIKEESDSGATSEAPVPRRRGARAVAVGVLAMVVMGVGAWLHKRSPAVGAPSMRVVPLTTRKGVEGQPTFSPDGEQVAFTWNGEQQDNFDIYVTIVGSSEVRRLTSDPAPDSYPRWSPDGRQIAFLRSRPDGNTIQLVSAVGGADRTLSGGRGAVAIAWSPDGRSLAVGRGPRFGLGGQSTTTKTTEAETGNIDLLSVESDERRVLIQATKGLWDVAPAFSPDGRRLAYSSCSFAISVSGVELCDVYVVDLDATFAPTAPPRRLTRQATLGMGFLAWTRDGASVVYEALSPTLSYLWRVAVDGTRPAERIEIAGFGASAPTIALSRDRLAFERDSVDTDVYRFQAGRPVQAVVASTFAEEDVHLSADGRRLAFASTRSGVTSDIWIAGADGSGLQQLTHGPGRVQGSPSWSPDARRIAFDSFTDDGHWHIWLVDVDGGTPHRLTTESGDQNVPMWSHDGRWIYYSADQGTGRDIWRVPVGGGAPERMISGASGPFYCESPDSKSLLYQPQDADSPLMAMPLDGREARQLLTCVKRTAFGTSPQSVYYVPCDSSPDPTVHVMDPVTGTDRSLGTLEKLNDRPLGLAVSPDGTSIFYVGHSSVNANLMLIENFH